MFKKGDRVRLTRDQYSFGKPGMTGIVRDVAVSGNPHVEFDGLPETKKRAFDGKFWCFPAVSLEKIEEGTVKTKFEVGDRVQIKDNAAGDHKGYEGRRSLSRSTTRNWSV